MEKLRLVRAWYIRFTESASMGILRSFSDSKQTSGGPGGLGVLGSVGRGLVVIQLEFATMAQTVNPY